MSADVDTSPGVALETAGLAVAYGRTRVLDDIDLHVPRGSVFALLGRNGSGKTSLLRCVLGQRPAAAGRLKVLGEDPWQRRYMFKCPAKLDPGGVEVISGGPDRTFKGNDNISSL